MIRLKTIILFVLSAAAVLLPPAGLLAFAGEVGRQKDSLLTLLPALEGEAKLKILLEIAKYTRDTGEGMQAEEEAVDRLLREARLQKNKDMEAEALLLMLLCYNNYNDKERYLAISDEAGRFYLDNGYMEHYWEYLFLEVNLLHTSNDQEKVIGLDRKSVV